MPRNFAASLSVLAAVTLSLAACDDRRSGDASGDGQPAEQTGAIGENTPAERVETDTDPTPQTGRGGAIPETEEGASQ